MACGSLPNGLSDGCISLELAVLAHDSAPFVDDSYPGFRHPTPCSRDHRRERLRGARHATHKDAQIGATEPTSSHAKRHGSGGARADRCRWATRSILQFVSLSPRSLSQSSRAAALRCGKALSLATIRYEYSRHWLSHAMLMPCRGIASPGRPGKRRAAMLAIETCWRSQSRSARTHAQRSNASRGPQYRC
jgi:hypothetical protein